MKVILIAASSLDGYVTRGNEANIYEWTSKQDTEYFFKLIENAQLILMGAKTYGAARHFIKHKEGRKRIVFTHSPQKYKSESVQEFLEFTSRQPGEVLKQHEDKASEALLIGGTEIYSLFLKQKLVDEIWITVEPLLFGDGKKLSEVNCRLKLLESKKLNTNGTMLLKYQVLN